MTITASGSRIDPQLFALPPDPVVEATPRIGIADALAASGLADEIEPEASAARRAAPWTSLTVRGGSQRFLRDRIDERVHTLAWPASLYVPRDADWRDFWITEPPASHRYALAWPAAGNGVVPDHASADTGEAFAFTSTPFTDPGRDSRAEAGVGILYSPAFTLGTVDVEPDVEVRDGMLAAVLDYFPILSAGSVTLTASVVIALWQVIPGGYDLIDYGVIPIARITRDQSFGATREPLPGGLYSPRPFSKRFLVEGSRQYAIGAIARVEVASSLTDDHGRPLAGLNGSTFKVYAHETLRFPSISVETRTVYQP